MNQNQNQINATNQTNALASNGRFAPGNLGGPGNLHAEQVSKLRAAIRRAVARLIETPAGRLLRP